MEEIEPGVWLVWKEWGETPLEAISRLRSEYNELKDEKMTYAGRLDPAAEGLLIVLVGEKCKEKNLFLKLDKKYEFEIVFGISTDTADLLGLPNSKLEVRSQIEDKKLEIICDKLKGYHEWPYPAYSSKTVDGRPLWLLSREKKSDFKWPIIHFEIYDLEFSHTSYLSGVDLLAQVMKLTSVVNGDFRQENIRKNWQELLAKPVAFQTAKFNITCSSGTYVRSVVEKIGEELRLPTVTKSIKRTQFLNIHK